MSLHSHSSMNPPADDVDLKPEKLEEEKESGPLFHCDLYDTDIVHKISQAFLPGLASACIDNTTGGLLRSPASVAVDIRREMVDYLIQRSENFVAESVVLEVGPDVQVSDNPYDIISDFVDDFVSSKRNFFSRVSGWLLSDRREDRIDDLVQEMEINGFWLLNRRNSVAQTLLKNVDFKNIYHCSFSFKSQEELDEHKLHCSYRTVSCSNEGCNSIFSAAQMDHHDSMCPFKMLPCEQNCSDSIMRRDMDRHCITICPMKLVKCPFYSIGCQSAIPQSTVNQHRSENLRSHLLYVLQVLHKNASTEDLKQRAEEVEKLSSPERIASARDARSLTMAIKDIDAKLGPLIVKTNAEPTDEAGNLIDGKMNHELAINEVRSKSPSKEKENNNLPSQGNDIEDTYDGKKEPLEPLANLTVQSQPNKEEVVPSISVQEKVDETQLPREGNVNVDSPTKDEAQIGKSQRVVEEQSIPPPVNKQEEPEELVSRSKMNAESTAKNELPAKSLHGEENFII